MLSIFKYIQKIYKNPSVADEDWLEPSDQLLSKIQKEIDKTEKRKNYPFGIIFLLLLLAGLSTFLVFFDSIYKSNDSTLSTENTQRIADNSNLKAETKIHSSNASAVKSSNEDVVVSKDDKNVTNTTSLAAKSKSTNTVKSKNKLTSPGSSIVKTGNLITTFSKNTEVNNLSTVNSIGQNNTSPLYAENQKSVKGKVQPFLKEQNLIQSKSDLLTVEQSDTDIKKFDFEGLSYLEITALNPVHETNLTSDAQTFPKLPTTAIEINKNKNTFYVDAGIGASIWDFKLNDTYSDLVEPAAYENSLGTGLASSLTLGKNFGNRFGVALRAQYESIQLSSGHNSVITYDNNLSEQNHDLTMATPLGLVNNEVALLRVSDSGATQTELIVDLENEHTLTALDFSLLFTYDLIRNDKFSFTVMPGIGIEHITSSKNSLTLVDTNNSDILSGGSVAEGGFDALQKTSPFASINFSIQKAIFGDWHIGLLLNSSMNLRPIQETGDLNTRVTRYNSQLVLRRSF